MAASPAIAASLFPKPIAARLPAVRSSVGAVPPPPRLTRRRNYLRRKLLKTLTKPSPQPLTPTQTPTEIGVPEFDFEPPRDLKSPDSENMETVEESEASSSDSKGPQFVQVSVSEGSGSGSGRVSARTVVRFGAYFVGIFILQAVVRALLKGSADSSDDKRRRRRGDREELGLNGNGSPFGEKIEVKDGAILYVNEAEMETKISEIRMMAKEAKERERKNSENGNFGEDNEEDDSDDDDDDDDDEVKDDSSRVRSGIEREVDGRMTRVRRGLGTARENSQVMNVNFLNKPEKGKTNVSGQKEEDNMLMFEKRYKFRNGDSSKPREKPKGFQGSDRIGRKESVNGKENGVASKALRLDMDSSGDLRGEASKIVDVKKTTETPKEEPGDKSLGVDLKKEIEENAEQQKGGKTEASGKHVVPRTNGRSKARRVESTSSTSRGNRKEADDSSNLWWLNLPYLLAIAMQQGYEDEVERGFYSLKTVSDNPSQTQASYTVLFEDRADAQNFCHLLESHFEELDDMSVFVVPLPIKELNDAVKSQTKKVIVVRKGQLRLYAGQPLDEVETALHSLLK